MEINNGYYTMNPDKYLAEIEEVKRYLKEDEFYTEQDFDDDVFEIRDNFYAECYEKAEELGFIHRCALANGFMADFDRLAGIEKVAKAKGWEKHFILVA